MAIHIRNKMKFDYELFIEDIKKFPCIYDKKNKDYKNRDMRKAVWMAIGATFGMTADEAEKKWRVQRDRYNKEKKTMELSKESDEVYVPSWVHFNSIDKILSKSDEDLCLVTKVEPWDNFQEEDSLLEDSSVSDNTNLVAIKYESDFQESEAENSTSLIPAPSKPESAKISSKRKREDEFLSGLQSTSKMISDYYFAKSAMKNDRASLFCQYLESRLKSLKSARCSRTIRLIEKVVQQAEIEQEEEEIA